MKNSNIEKKFDEWNVLKKDIALDFKQVHFKERDVCFMYLGKNIGFEQDGKGESRIRPVVIVKKFNRDLFWGVALTTQEKTGKYYFRFTASNNKINHAILSQLRLYDSKRIKNKIGVISKNDFQSLIECIKNLFPQI